MNQTFKSNFLDRWERYFSGAELPIALFYSDALHQAGLARKYAGHHCIIADFVKVMRGTALAFENENMGCKGGSKYCGFSENLRPKFEYFLSYGIEGELEGERYKKDPETVETFLKTNQQIIPPGKYLIAKPFDQLTDEDEPEIILFFAKPDVLAGLFTLANFDRKDPYGVKTPFGSGCGTIMQYAFHENRNAAQDCFLGMFDSSARPYVPKESLSFAIPYKRFKTLVGYMDESFLITETWEVIRKRMI